MENNIKTSIQEPLPKRLRRFFVGLIILAAFYAVLASGYTPPGICGEVLRHNMENDIDASPFWYMDLENMSEYEAAVANLRLRRLQETVDTLNTRTGD
jgi:hypothetical protein